MDPAHAIIVWSSGSATTKERDAADAIEFLMAGATAVAVGTPNVYEPQTALQVIAGLREFMERRRIQDVREIVGSVQVGK